MIHILRVQDQVEIFEHLSRPPKCKRCDVVPNHNGQDAVEKARASIPDFILFDVSLSVIDSRTVARTMRSDPSLPCMPIIALTAHAMSGDREKTLAAGGSDYYPKPVDFMKLVG